MTALREAAPVTLHGSGRKARHRVFLLRRSSAQRPQDRHRPVRDGQRAKKRCQQRVADDELRAGWPVLVFVVEEVYSDARCPIHGDEHGQCRGCPFATPHLVVQQKGQHAEGQDRQDGEPTVDVHQLLVEGAHLGEVFLPAEAVRHLEARAEHAQVPDRRQPERDVQERVTGLHGFKGRGWFA